MRALWHLWRGWLGVEERLDHAILAAGRALAAWGRAYSSSVECLAVRGLLRVGLDLLGEATSLAAVGGVVLLALAQPAFHETGPGWLKRLDLSVTFLDREGREIGRRGIRHDDSATLATIPDLVVRAVLATEDRRFFSHYGIDPIGLVRALVANANSAGVVQGGSTLTQQLAKNLFLSNERSLERKISEAFLALWLEAHLSKREILQLYLDRGYMGAGTFGVGAAAQYYFGKPIADVTLPEAAMLAGMFKAPSRYAPHAHLAAAQARAADVLDAMVDARALTPTEAAAARATPATVVARDPQPTPDYFLDWAFTEVAKRAASESFADSVLIVRTGFDPAIQRAAETAVRDSLDREGERLEVDQAAAVVMTPDGIVRAMVGGRDYADSQFNRATDALRQPGSSFKPFVYAAALAFAGYHPDTNVVDSEICIGRWCPQNYGRSHAGGVPLWLALAKSINTIPVKLSVAIGRAVLDAPHPTPRQLRVGHLAALGRERIIDLARRMGLRTPLPDTPSLPIGAAEVTVLDMTSAYAVMANGGLKADPAAALTIRNSRDRVLYDRGAERRLGVLSPGIVAEMNTMLSRVPEQGTGRRAALPGIRSAGKTGTTNGYRDAWYMGFTGDLVTGVWFGNDDHSPTREITGGSLPAATWKALMSEAERGLEPKPIPGLPETATSVARGGRSEPAMAAFGGSGSQAGFAPVTAARLGFSEAAAPARP